MAAAEDGGKAPGDSSAPTGSFSKPARGSIAAADERFLAARAASLPPCTFKAYNGTVRESELVSIDKTEE